MAKAKKNKPAEPPSLSKLAQWMVNAYGQQRLKMMRSEYQAGLPKWMAEAERNARIAAIDEIFPPTK